MDPNIIEPPKIVMGAQLTPTVFDWVELEAHQHLSFESVTNGLSRHLTVVHKKEFGLNSERFVVAFTFLRSDSESSKFKLHAP